LGRLPVLSYLEPLDKAAMKDILVKPKNALVKQFAKLFELEGVKFVVEEDALDYIVDKAMENKLGARGLRSIMEAIMNEAMYEIPSEPGVQEFVLTREYAVSRIEKSDHNKLKVA
jgi:ATP-dependent Clp protease ATP-binding subunit ClpX